MSSPRTLVLLACLSTAAAWGCSNDALPEPAEAPSPAPAPAVKAPQLTGAAADRARELILASPFSDQAAVLEGALAPHVTLRPTRAPMAEIPLGGSRLAGVPDLPADFTWPVHGAEPMTLLAQLDLSEVAPHAPADTLPSEGWLLVFWAVDSEGWGYSPESAETFAVLYIEGSREELTRTPSPAALPQWAQTFSSCSITFEPGVSLPDWHDLRYPKTLDLEQHLEAMYELWLRVTGLELPGGTFHHLLGHPQLVQGDPRTQAAKHRGGKPGDWNLLLQLETDEAGPGWMWGDVGTVFVYLRDEDLQERRFDQAWLVMQCH